MKLLLGATLLALIALGNCQFEPNFYQELCFTATLLSNPDGFNFNNCPNETVLMADGAAVCRAQDCLETLNDIYSGCGYDLEFS